MERSMSLSRSSDPVNPGDEVWVKAVVSRVTPNAVIVILKGPGGGPVTAALTPDQDWADEGDPTPAA